MFFVWNFVVDLAVKKIQFFFSRPNVDTGKPKNEKENAPPASSKVTACKANMQDDMLDRMKMASKATTEDWSD